MRRLLSLSFIVYAMIVMAAGPTHAASAPEATIRDLYGALLRAMEHRPELGQKGRYDALAPEIRRSFDLRSMAQRAVGLTWARLSPGDQDLLAQALARYTIAT